MARSIPRSLAFRAALSCSIVSAVAAAGLGAIVSSVARSQIEAEHRAAGRQLASQLARALGEDLAESDGATPRTLLEEIRGNGLVRYASIFDENGDLRADASAMGLEPPPSARRFDAFGATERQVAAGPIRLTEIDAPIRAPRLADGSEDLGNVDSSDRRGRLLGTLRIGISRDGVIARIGAIHRHLALWAVAATALAALASILAARFAVRPLQDLVDATQRIGAGEFRATEESLPMQGELAELSSALIAMQRALEAKSNELFATNRDLERRIAERTERLQAALDEAQKAERTRDNILSCISHEFRTPLSSIRAFAEILAQHPDESKETRAEFLSIILVESERLSDLVTNILDYVKFLSGDVNWILDPVDLLDVAREAASRFETLLAEHRMRLSIEFAPGLPTVRCDRDKLLRAVSNVLSNAIKFSADGSRIEVRAGRRNDCVDLAISDHGIGIAPEDRERIFQRFHQTEDTLTGKPKGTGLGLPIAREIVERHGGSLRVESARGHGSTFHLVLPIDGPSEDELRKTRTALARVD